MIRYNTELTTFEGFGPGNSWGSLGGVINTARSTYVKAYDDNTIVFTNDNNQSALIDATGNVGIGTTPTYAMDVANDINTWETYKVNGVTVIDNNYNLSNINDAYVGGLLTASNLTVYGTISGIFDTAVAVSTTVEATAQASITQLDNLVSAGNNVSLLTIGATTTEFTGAVKVDTITSTSNLITSNLNVFNTSIFNNDVIINGDTHVSGTIYAGKIRLGTLYSTTTVNGTLAATLSIATQLGITQLGTVTVANLTATNPIVGNITGNAGTATYASTAGNAGYVTFPSQPNITSVGSLTSLNVLGNITADSLTLNSNIAYDSLAVTSNISADSLNIANNISAASLNISGNITADSLTLANEMVFNSLAVTNNISGASLNISGNITADSLTLNSNLIYEEMSANNLLISSNITAQSLTLGGFSFNVSQGNVMTVVYNGSNVFQITA
jgi:hypothetical protein